MKIRTAFTMIELIFVIVIMGIIGKFGVEFLAQAYKSFIFSNINNELQQNSANAVEFIASRLQYRIKDSTIVRTGSSSTPIALASASSSDDYIVLEWVASDIDGFRSTTKANWSGILDLNDGNNSALVSPETNTTMINTYITMLSDGNSSMDDAALFFIGADSIIETGYGWDGNLTAINAQQGAMHPVQSVSGNINQFQTSVASDFTGIDIYEYYKLAWTANAIVYEAKTSTTGTLKFYYDYQPWDGEDYSDGKDAIIMENVSTFRFVAIGSIVKIQVCVKSDLVSEETYSICKEKTIY